MQVATFFKLQPFLRRTFSLLLPPSCPLCRQLILVDEALCPSCWSTLSFITDPSCFGCGIPLECGEKGPILCGSCQKNPFPFLQTRAALKYTPSSRSLVLQFKYHDTTYLAPLFANWMAQAIEQDPTFLQDVSMIAPVPLHWTRLWGRGFNQAALIGAHLSRLTKISFNPQLLKRTRATPSQGTKSRKKREQTLKKAFCVHPHFHSLIQDKTILLVDDVMASGATLRFCADVLLTEGARGVKVAALCRSSF